MDGPAFSSGAGSRRAACPPFQDLEQLAGVDGLGQVVVHAGGEARFPVTFHGVGGHGDDGQFPEFFHGPDSAAGFDPIHDRHGQVHEHGVVGTAGLLQPAQGFEAVGSHVRLRLHLLQDGARNLLVEDVVIYQQNAQPLDGAAPGTRLGSSGLSGLFRDASEVRSDRVEGRVRGDRLGYEPGSADGHDLPAHGTGR